MTHAPKQAVQHQCNRVHDLLQQLSCWYRPLTRANSYRRCNSATYEKGRPGPIIGLQVEQGAAKRGALSKRFPGAPSKYAGPLQISLRSWVCRACFGCRRVRALIREVKLRFLQSQKQIPVLRRELWSIGALERYYILKHAKAVKLVNDSQPRVGVPEHRVGARLQALVKVPVTCIPKEVAAFPGASSGTAYISSHQ
jgi:hypothetical protein